MLSEDSAARFFQMLREDLQHLASDPPGQEAYLRELGTWDCLDELAEEFDQPYTTLKSESRLSEAQALVLGRLDAAIERISGEENAVLW
jgi:hypothetical protein